MLNVIIWPNPLTHPLDYIISEWFLNYKAPRSWCMGSEKIEHGMSRDLVPADATGAFKPTEIW